MTATAMEPAPAAKNQVAKKGVGYLRTLLEGPQFRTAMEQALPRHLPPDRFLRIALTCLTRTPKLGECDPASFFSAMLTLTQLGIEPDGRRAHLIPFGKTVQLIIDYKGIAELVMRSGLVSNLHADVVCDADDFDYDAGVIRKHKVDFKESRGNVYAVYAICRFKDGSEKAEVMSREDVEAIRKRSRAGGSGPWVTDWNEMAKKTVFRRLSKWLPLSPEVIRAVEEGDDSIIPVEPGSAVKHVGYSALNEAFNLPVETDAASESTADAIDEARGEESQETPENPDALNGLADALGDCADAPATVKLEAEWAKGCSENQRAELAEACTKRRKEIAAAKK